MKREKGKDRGESEDTKLPSGREVKVKDHHLTLTLTEEKFTTNHMPSSSLQRSKTTQLLINHD